MQAEKTVHYEKHPVSAERKAELVAAGYQIFDITYAPEGWKAEAKKDDKKDDKKVAKKSEGE